MLSPSSKSEDRILQLLHGSSKRTSGEQNIVGSHQSGLMGCRHLIRLEVGEDQAGAQVDSLHVGYQSSK